MSNLSGYKTSWVWNKKQSGSFANAKYHPLKITEDILVFGNTSGNYHPIMRTGRNRRKGTGVKTSNQIIIGLRPSTEYISDQYFPTNILDDFPSARINRLHPTEKPVALLEYLIKTYSNPGATILDNCFGSCSTGIACLNTDRNFIGIELDANYYRTGLARMLEHRNAQRNSLLPTPIPQCPANPLNHVPLQDVANLPNSSIAQPTLI